MHQIIEKLKALSSLEQNSFNDEILNVQPEAGKLFFSLLKCASVEEREDFFAALLDKSDITWYKKYARKASDIKDLEIPQIREKILAILATIPAKQEALEKNTADAIVKTKEFREIMKANFLVLNTIISDQSRGLPVPPVQKSVEEADQVITLPEVDRSVMQNVDLFDCLNNRKSRRKYTDKALSIAELSFLLWATQGIRSKSIDCRYTVRTVASGGSRHPFETYLAVHNVDGLKPGFYRYQPLEHALVYLFDIENRVEKVAAAALDQKFVGNCAVTFIWSVIPYRCEWRYTTESKKIILQDSGHLCQNLYIACEAINSGTCAIGAYNQQLFDEMLKLDGIEEFTVYVAPVGKISKIAPIVILEQAELQKFCARYYCETEELTRTILFRDGNLFYQRTDGSESKLEAIESNKFKIQNTDLLINFVQSDNKYKMILTNEDDESHSIFEQVME